MDIMNDAEETQVLWNRSLVFDNATRKSELCKTKDFYTGWYSRWCEEIKETPRLHRKQWEFAYVLQALYERGCIGEGRRGLGFAVGTEPLPAVMAKYGCEITATDIQPERGEKLGWANGSQLCLGVDSLNTRGICEPDIFYERVHYRSVDMNAIPGDLKGFDFNWSSCSFEHLGSIEKGLRFLRNQLKTLRPGGWAVHTTEYNISSNDRTLDKNENTVIFRKKDIDAIVAELTQDGCFVEELDYSLGGLPEDYKVDVYPYRQDVHLRLQLDSYVATSIGLIIRKRPSFGSSRRFFGFFRK